MIRSFRHKGLAKLFEQGHSRRVRPDLQARCLRRLEALDQAESLAELNVPGFAFMAFMAFMDYLNATVSTSTARGVSRLNGKTTKRSGSISSNIIEVKSWMNISSSIP